MSRHAAQPPLALYVHIPWCVAKCPYCDFNSYTLVGDLDQHNYVDALLADLDRELPLVQGRELESIFIGGGTPSLFSGDAIQRLLQGVGERIPWRPEAEITLEANPGVSDDEQLRDYRRAGVNRLSIGVQSFEDEKLVELGRIHDRWQAVDTVEMAKAVGFDNFNIDLMYGLPNQTPEQALTDVEIATGLGPAHISYYQLTLEPNTRFFNSPPALPVDDLLVEIEQAGRRGLESAGYAQYEVSAFARQGRECRHNLNYWTFGDYMGIGAGAHGKLTSSDGTRVERRWRVSGPAEYGRLAGSEEAIAGRKRLGEQDLVAEFMMNALRLKQGFDPSLFVQRTRLPLERFEQSLASALERGLITRKEEVIGPTALGWRFLDELVALFLPEAPDE
jgi:oxygen-independent coproporphyrinogen-3 oxidase